jgi:hypothetical protein
MFGFIKLSDCRKLNCGDVYDKGIMEERPANDVDKLAWLNAMNASSAPANDVEAFFWAEKSSSFQNE